MNQKPLILLVGKSGSGKTTVAEHLEKHYNMKMLNSYTTREPRYKGENGHTFITQEEYLTLKDKIATTYFNGNYYCCTLEQCDNDDVYTIDPHGIKTYYRNYHGDRPSIIVYLKTNWLTRAYRMLKRGDSFKKTIQRIWHDYNEFYGFPKNRDDVYVVKCDNKNVSQVAFYIFQTRATLCILNREEVKYQNATKN